MGFSETYLREASESRKFESARKVEVIIPFMDQIQSWRLLYIKIPSHPFERGLI